MAAITAKLGAMTSMRRLQPNRMGVLSSKGQRANGSEFSGDVSKLKIAVELIVRPIWCHSAYHLRRIEDDRREFDVLQRMGVEITACGLHLALKLRQGVRLQRGTKVGVIAFQSGPQVDDAIAEEHQSGLARLGENSAASRSSPSCTAIALVPSFPNSYRLHCKDPQSS